MELIKDPEGRMLTLVRELYERAFPKSEKKPFSLMEKKCTEGSMEIYAIADGEDFLGLAIFILDGRLALLDYLAIDEDRRGGGIGSEMLREVKRLYPDRVLLLEIEDPDEEGADNREERVRRLGFYNRNGLFPMDYKVSLFGVQILSEKIYSPMVIFVLPAGAFLTLGFIIAAVQKIRNSVSDRARLKSIDENRHAADAVTVEAVEKEVETV